MTNHVQLELTSHLRPARCLFASKPSYHSFLFVTIYSCTHLNSLRCELEPSLGSHQEEQLFLLPLLEPVYKHVTKMNGITLYIYKQKPDMFIKTIKRTKNKHTQNICKFIILPVVLAAVHSRDSQKSLSNTIVIST